MLRLFKLLLVLLPLAGVIFSGVPTDQRAAAQTVAVPPRQGMPYRPPTEPGGYTASIGSTLQLFDHGFMTWRADNGMIWAFVNDGKIYSYPSEVYGRLPNTTVYRDVPAGWTVPTMGFKRVYDNFADLRAALGWGVGGETGFLMEFLVDYQGNVYITTSPDVPILIAPDGTWRSIDRFPEPPTNPQPPVIVSFTVTPTTIERGDTVRLTWNVQNTTSVNLSRGALGVPVDLGTYPPIGALDYTALSADVYEIPFSVIPVDEMGRKSQTVRQVLTVTIRCPYTYFFGATSVADVAGTCPLDAVQTVPGAFQTFEQGMMIWRSDTHEILVLYPDGRYWPFADTWTDGEPDAVTETPPTGRYAPVRGFGKLWASENSGNDATPLRQKVGWATAPETSYTIQVQTIAFKNRYYAGYAISLPDGRAIHVDTMRRQWQVMTP